MKKKIYKSLALTVGLLGLLLLIKEKNIDSANAYYGNWKSQQQSCKIVVTVFKRVGIDSWTESDRLEYEGTRRRCVDGAGLCLWSSSCS